jgi:DNA-binding transcriptional ArsR family regulator
MNMHADRTVHSPLRLSGVEAMRAVAHPTRLRMLELLRREALSASGLAKLLQIRFGSARFHLQKLVRAGLAQPAGERRVRGGRELLFSASPDVRVDLDPSAPDTIAAMHHALVTEVGRRLGAAAADQREGDSDLDLLSLSTIELTARDRAEAERIADEALRRIRSLGGPRTANSEPVTLSLFLFRTPRHDRDDE